MIDCNLEDYTAIIDSPCGLLGILDDGHVVQAVNFLCGNAKLRMPRSPLGEKVVLQLGEFFSDPTYHFDLPLTTSVTPFQLKARQALLRIPVGKTMNYGSVAKEISSSARAIAGACRRNPIPIIVPCHRVVAINGLGGFSGKTDGKPLDNKKWLLNHESEIK